MKVAIVGNKKRRKLIGGAIAVLTFLTLIVAPLEFVFDAFDLNKPQTVRYDETPVFKLDEESVEQIVTGLNDSTEQEKPSFHKPNESEKPSEPKNRSVSLNDMDSKALDNANISVTFRKILGEEFAKLTIIPRDSEPVSLPIYGEGQFIEFNSGNKKYIASVAAVNFIKKKIVVSVSSVN